MILGEIPAPSFELLYALLRHKSYFALFAAAMLATLLLTPAYIHLARRRGWVEQPGGRRQHPEATPTMGGLVVLAVVFAGVAVALSLGNRVAEMLREHANYIVGALACTAAMTLVGIVDDRVGLRAKTKLLVQVVLGFAAFLVGFRIGQVTVPWLGSVSLGALALPATILWVATITNAINLSDGLDGLAAGIGFLASATNAFVAVYLQNYYMAVMMVLLAGALLGFLRWNFHPARVFLGNAGSNGLGMFLALCSLHAAQKAPTAVMILVPLCALGYPIFDLLLTVARRMIAGQPMFASDRQHIHHRLLERGYGASGAALRIYAASVALIGLCILLSSMNHFFVGLGLAATVVLAVFSTRVLGYLEWGGWAALSQEREQTRVLHAAAELARLKLSAARRCDEVLEALAVLGAEIGVVTLEVEQGDEVYRWQRPGRRGADGAREEPLVLGLCAARMERISAAGGDPRGDQLWEEACRLAGERLAAWAVPSGASKVSA